ncbi:MAG: phosphatase PAP2 family protein [Nocardioidaceae bacterium]
MPVIRASWQLSAGITVVLAVVWLACSMSQLPSLRKLRAFTQEFVVVVGVFAVYQHTAYLVHGRTAHAFSNAMGIWHLERRLHLPSEVAVQHLTASLPLVERGMNAYYDGMHLTAMTAFVVWMWWRHRDRYVLLRNTVALTTLACVLIQMVPVAPPRMFPALGFTDTASRYGMSMYSADGIADQLGAMPSIHVAWAGIVCVFGVMVCAPRWRWLFVGHFVLVGYVVVATANHWWLDGAVGLAVMVLVLAFLLGIAALGRRLFGTHALVETAIPDEAPAHLAG